MLTRVITKYAKCWVEVSVKYHCIICGHKFTRKNTDWFTMNPFNKSSVSENQDRLREKCKQRVRPCPKCHTEVKPS